MAQQQYHIKGIGQKNTQEGRKIILDLELLGGEWPIPVTAEVQNVSELSVNGVAVSDLLQKVFPIGSQMTVTMPDQPQ
jgi:hypothetical protein